jgi:hypothetical protein
MKNIMKYMMKNILFISLFILLAFFLYIFFSTIHKGKEYFTEQETIENQATDKMKQYNVIFGGIVKDVEPYIENALKNIDKCGSKFKSYSVVIYENDSTDNTRKILLENKKDNYHYFLEDGITEPHRTIRLASCRNKLIEKVKEINKNGEYTYLILLDMDDRNSSGTFVKSIETCFKYNTDEWDVLTCNQKIMYYDTWPLRKKDTIDYDCWGEYFKTSSEDKKKEIKKNINNTVFEKNGLLEVDSAFGGIAIYKIKSLHNCKYVGEYKNNEYPEHGNQKCEHVDFHKCIKENGGKLFINTEFYND